MDNNLKYRYKNLIIEQIKNELNLDKKILQKIRDRLNKANVDELERIYEAFERFGVKIFMEEIGSGKYEKDYIHNNKI